MSKAVFVVGHKNPDTDSICAAIAYANLKNKTSGEPIYIAKKAGPLNEETRYVLNKFGVEVPETIEDVSTQVEDIDFRQLEGVDGHISLKKAWELMKERDVVTLPVVSATGRLEGVIVNGDIAYSYMDVYDNSILSRARTQYKNIIETINGTMLTGNDHAYFVKGRVVVASTSHADIPNEVLEDDLAIVGNIKERQMMCVKARCSCLIVCSSNTVDEEVIELARANECVLIATEYDCFTVARLIHQSMPIRQFMKRENIISFDLDDYVDDVKEIMKKVRHRDFPVLDEQHKYVGMLSRRLMMNMARKQVILVDHNEKSQAVDGIEQAEVLEIIDHHRLGSLETVSPILFRNQPVGSTATIIALIYKEQKVAMEKEIAGILCSAIISDTLMFRSPTCTAIDKRVAGDLAVMAGIDIKEHATAMFEAGSDFKSKTKEQILHQDYKIFYSDDVSFAVSQVSSVSRRQLNSIKEELRQLAEAECKATNINMMFVMLTDIFDEESEIICTGSDAERLLEMAFNQTKDEDGQFMLKGVVSRKKQLIPPLMEALQN